VEWLETTGKTVEDAKDFLLDQLGVDEEETEFEILEEPKAGLFGRQRGVARVRARIAPKSPRPKDDRRRRRGGSKGKAGDGPKDEAGSQERSTADAAPKAGGQRSSGRDASKPAAAKSRGNATGGDRESSRESGGRGGRTSSPAEDVDPAPFVAPLVEFYEGILGAAGLTGSVAVDVTEERELAARIEGDQLGSIIGPAGGVIDALQDLGRTFLQKEAKGGSSPRMKLDVASYRARRREELTRFATDVAEKVLATGDAHAFEVMGSVDRKTIHDAVNEVEGVQTISKGEDPDRYVVIAPA